ncbi:hypothetical protein UFOVP128_75 [uncultured Caudovirales phage]|uniref:Uncharacterized protein n=1 Tax=uncultured Caudovirales phage TaxID=2100421 RepID=A0A6J5L9S4_9CAUD|nr:hypothetical protein UFOVP128_75 [uncultured Caudovirales phage]CAB5222075.1 hypothetical protein UFOVP243_44 [uncultured Caudovirales phage]
MSKFTFSFNDNQVIIVDSKNNKETIELLNKLDTIESLNAIGKEQNASIKASVGALSLLAEMLSDARFDFYKGKTPMNEKIPKEFNSALRDKISEHMKPAFIANQIAKGAKPDTADNQWQIYASGLNTGSFSNAKTWAVKFYCQLGKLPTVDNDKLLPLRAIIKMLEDAKIPLEDKGIAGKLIKIASELESRTEKTELGDYASAIAALKSMLATFEGLHSESLERLTQAIGNTDIVATAQAVIAKASDVPSVESLEAQYLNGQLSDTDYALKMLTFHNVQIEFDESPM